MKGGAARAAVGVAVTMACAAGPVRAQNRFLGSPGCGVATASCHAKVEGPWWVKDKHHASIDLLSANEKQATAIVGKYGLKFDDIYDFKKVNCMSCHGTVVSGNESEVDDPVSCESCHGPGSAYKDPHAKGYDLGVKNGMAPLKDLNVRASTCVRCHYVVDQKLLATGHPSGANFDYVAGIRKVSGHWKHPAAATDLDAAPFQAAKAKLGPVGKTPPPPPAPAPKPPPAVSTTAGSKPEPTAGQAAPAPVVALPLPVETPAPPPRASAPGTVVPAPEEPVAVVLPPRPAVSDTASVRELLLVVKKRLEQLYGQVRK